MRRKARNLGGGLLAALALIGLAAPIRADEALDLGRLRLTDGEGQAVPSEQLDGKFVALYFSASWCAPCRHFTPILTEAYEAWRKDGKDIEVVLVPFDRTPDAARAYLAEMPWIGLEFDADRVQELSRRYQVRGIPTLVVLDSEGEVVSLTGREEVMRHREDAIERWSRAETAAIGPVRQADALPGITREGGAAY